MPRDRSALEHLFSVSAFREAPGEPLALRPQRHDALQQLFTFEEKRPHGQRIEQLVADDESGERAKKGFLRVKRTRSRSVRSRRPCRGAPPTARRRRGETRRGFPRPAALRPPPKAARLRRPRRPRCRRLPRRPSTHAAPPSRPLPLSKKSSLLFLLSPLPLSKKSSLLFSPLLPAFSQFARSSARTRGARTAPSRSRRTARPVPRARSSRPRGRRARLPGRRRSGAGLRPGCARRGAEQGASSPARLAAG